MRYSYSPTDPMSLMGIYAIINTHDGALYLGSTFQRCRRRWKAHLSQLQRHCHVNHGLQQAFDLFGADGLSFVILETVQDKALLLEREQAWRLQLTAEGAVLYNEAVTRRPYTRKSPSPSKRQTRPCLYCGEPFPVSPSLTRLKYCSHEHYILHTKRSIEERFWELVDKPRGRDACWLWKGSISPYGYGRFSISRNGTGVWVYAHRFMFELIKGPILPGFMVCHSCDVRPCVQPKHLSLGMAADNTADMIARGRMATGERSGARLHPEKIPRGANHWTKLMPERYPRGDDHYMRRMPEQRERRRGSNNPMAKLTQEQVDMIRSLIGTMSYKRIGELFNICASQVCLIANNKRWSKHT